MPSQDDIRQQQELLVTHRRTLAHHLRQQAQHGSAYVPPAVAHGIHETRAAIAQAALRGWGVAVDDHPDDTEPPGAGAPGNPPQGAGDQINAQGSQGFINRPSGSVHQHFGDIVSGDQISGDINVTGVSGEVISLGHGSQAQGTPAVGQPGQHSSTTNIIDPLARCEARLRVLLTQPGKEHPRYDEALVHEQHLGENIAAARL